MTRTISAIAVAALFVVNVPHAGAQFFQQFGSPAANIEGFTVTGKGFVSAKPNRLEIDLEVSAASELSADAIVKYRDAKRRLQEAFAALKLENVAVEELGLLVNEKGADFSPYFFGYSPNRKSKVEVQLARRLVVKCSKIGKMDEDAILELVAKLLDVAQDAGGKVGPGGMNPRMAWYYGYPPSQNGLVRFILDDYDKLQEEAYAKAIADAQAKAQRLAKLSGVKLGAVTAIREIVAPGPRESGQDDDIPRKQLETSRFQQIPLRVELMVRYETAAAAGANPKVGER
jgi:uncharacterized protein YggE